MTKLYLDVLNKPGQDLWDNLKVFSRSGTVLAGGTAIAMQIRHRISEDFDLFLQKDISSMARKKAFEVLDRPVNVVSDNPQQLTLVSKDGLKLTLLEYPYPPLHPLVKSTSLPLFSLPDLASNKAYTIGRRGTWRDYVDMYFLLRNKHVNLQQIIKEAQQRFKDEFNPKLFLQQLVYTKDLGQFVIDFLDETTSSEQIVSFFENQAREYLRTSRTI